MAGEKVRSTMKFFFIFLISILTTGCLPCNGQEKGQFCIGASIGYRIYSSALSFKYDFSKIMSLDADIIHAKYQPYGIGVGAVIYYPTAIKLKPFAEAYFSRLFGGNTSFGKSDEGIYTVVGVDAGTYFVPMIGVRYSNLEKGTNNIIGIFKFGYKINLPSPSNVYYISGPPDQQSIDKVNKYLENCFAVNLGVVINISKKKK
jgi:hypothetical protein